jgi:hypothetical protein
MADVEDFARENELMDILPELRKGALVARDPANFQNLPELDDEEKRVLTREVTNRWSQTRTLYFTIITCSIGAAVQGWDQTGSNGANLSFPAAFGIGNGGSKLPDEVHFPRTPFLQTSDKLLYGQDALFRSLLICGEALRFTGESDI